MIGNRHLSKVLRNMDPADEPGSSRAGGRENQHEFATTAVDRDYCDFLGGAGLLKRARNSFINPSVSFSSRRAIGFVLST
jgi:hypothetical protein